MFNFEFYNPTKIVFGEKTVEKLSGLIPASEKVLVLYGGNSAKENGTLDEVTQALAQHEVGYFGGIEANPTYETLMKAVEKIRQEKYTFLLAVGGGSVIDGTKFIAAAVNFNGDTWEMVVNRGKDIQQALPFGSVLTLPATGSEMNSASVISHKGKGAKLGFSSPLVYPRFSILDPTKTYTLPERQLANGLVDAFVHIMEQYLTYPADGMAQDRFAEGLLLSLIEIAPKVMKEPENYQARANFMWIATLALNGLIGAGVPQDWTTHAIGHELTARYGIDHARTLAVVLPAVMNVCRRDKQDKLLQYAERVWGITEGIHDERIDLALTRTCTFFEGLGMPILLSDYDIPVSDIDAIMQQLKSHGRTTLGERKNVTLDVVHRILENCF